MNPRPAVAYSVDADGVGWIVFDDPDARANIFTLENLTAFERAFAAAEQDPTLKAVVVASAKKTIFIAGADLSALETLPDAAAATEFSRRGQRVFQRVADACVPVVVAIHGACAGGGFELALAAHWRIASDASVTRIGLPETGIGTIPGWGGSVRLPRLIGVKAALDHILKAQLVSATAALDSGLIHQVVPATALKAEAKAAALKLAAEGVPPAPSAPARVPAVFAELRARVEKKSAHEPALVAAIDVVEQSAQLPVPAALDVEARIFGAITAGKICKNLIHAFRVREAAKKRSLDGWFPAASDSMLDVRRVGVVGAGVMGSGIAQWLAVQGFEVALRDVDADAIARGSSVIHGLFDDAVRRGKVSAGEANAAQHRITTTTAWEGFETCDVVIEAIVENASAKRALFSELARVVAPSAILASNTSALPIEEIAGHVPHPERTLGIHFFNPVSRMALVELIIGATTSSTTAQRALSLVKSLGKSPVICRSSPGFLVTRVLFFYLNEAVRMWEQDAGTSAMDDAMREFGWPMGPMRLIDEVGVDVTEFIFGELEQYFGERFTRSTACARLLADGLRGRKNGASSGFYRYDDGEVPNDNVTRPVAARVNDRALPGAAIVERLMGVMADEAQRCLDEGVVRSADDIDFALLSGAGFPGFRGGLMRWALDSR